MNHGWKWPSLSFIVCVAAKRSSTLRPVNLGLHGCELNSSVTKNHCKLPSPERERFLLFLPCWLLLHVASEKSVPFSESVFFFFYSLVVWLIVLCIVSGFFPCMRTRGVREEEMGSFRARPRSPVKVCPGQCDKQAPLDRTVRLLNCPWQLLTLRRKKKIERSLF